MKYRVATLLPGWLWVSVALAAKYFAEVVIDPSFLGSMRSPVENPNRLWWNGTMTTRMPVPLHPAAIAGTVPPDHPIRNSAVSAT